MKEACQSCAPSAVFPSAHTASVIAKKAKSKFDPKVFLATVDGGRTKLDCRKGHVIFAQGDPSDPVFFIEKGKVKVTVVSEQGKEAVIAFLQEGDFIGEACRVGSPCEFRRSGNERSARRHRLPLAQSHASSSDANP